jgi:glycosyltransferase involved in cell wall biosynthesis
MVPIRYTIDSDYNMKILFITDFSLDHNSGGAQRSNDIIVKTGIELKHVVHNMYHDSGLKTNDLIKLIGEHKYDYIISSNLELLSKEEGLIDLLYMMPNHIRLEHDMNMYLDDESRFKLFSNCHKTFFLTEYHHQKFRDFYGDYFQNVEIVADPIDTSVFYDFGKDREDATLYTGFMHSFKGTSVFINHVKENPSKKFIVAGWGSDHLVNQIKDLENVEYLEKVEYEKMPEVYNRVSSIFYKPNMCEPFCRSVGEAILCGVPNLVVNDIIGCVHEESRLGFDEFKNSCNNAADNFWSKIK